MDKRIEIATIDKTTIFRPSFINTLQGRLYRHLEKSPKGKKFRIIIEPVEKKKSDNEEFAITEKSTLREIAEHNPEMFARLMYTAFGPGWDEYFHWKATAIKEVEEHDSESVENNA